MSGGGQAAIRGYLIQTLIALLDALDDEMPWTSVTIEPNIKSDKVDILWWGEANSRAVQVKSSRNPFSKADIERWARELGSWKEADEYQLVLVGTPASGAVARIRRVGNVKVPLPKTLDLRALKEQAAQRLARFLQGNDLPQGDADHRETLVDALVGQLATLSTDGRELKRDDLIERLAGWTTRKAPPRKPTIPAAYLTWLQEDCADVDLLGSRVQHGQAVKLNNVYVPLTAAAGESKDRERGDVPRMGAEEQAVQTLLGLLEEDSLYVAGAPGSGKSTFCRWVAWLACEGKMPGTRVSPPKKYQERFPTSFAGRLPLLVRLRDFWAKLPQTPGCRDLSQAQLRSVMADWIEEKRPGGLTWNIIEPHLEAGSLLLILDGVDEVPLSQGEGRQTCQPRAMLLSGLVAALPGWTGRGNRVLLTSRPYGLGHQERQKLGVPSALVGDLDKPMRELLVRRWFGCLIEREEAAEATARQMLDHVAARPDVAALSANPMLLTAICIIYHQGQRLPEGRYDLYDRIVDNVLFNRFPQDREVIDPVRNRLAVVAYGMHTGEGLDEERGTPQAEVTVPEIDRMIGTYQDQTSWSEPAYTGAVEAREQLLTRSGLLLPRDGNRAGFYHLTFQDFLAAQRLLDVREAELFEVFRRRGPSPEWRSALCFVFGAQLARNASPQRSTELLGKLVGSLADDDVALSVLVGECLQVLLKRGVRLKSELEERYQQYCVAAIEREAPLPERHELGLALGQLGDPRIVTDLRDPTAYVEVAAGTYRIGDRKRGRQSRFDLKEPFLLSRYPVTNSQYAMFIDAGGYGERQGWSDVGWKWRSEGPVDEPAYWRDARWNVPNKPVVGVSYWEAEAFCRWAGGRLPDEREWEAAARGAEGREYPWGDEWEDGICNSIEAGLGETSAVGLFPRSRSVDLGLEDMAGNVWEWCSDLREAGRVLRGGYWSNDANFCRSAYRGRNRPDGRT